MFLASLRMTKKNGIRRNANTPQRRQELSSSASRQVTNSFPPLSMWWIRGAERGLYAAVEGTYPYPVETRIKACWGRGILPKIRFPGKASDFLKVGVAAAARGDLETVRATLEERPGWLTRVGARGRTMLWEASHRGRLGVVEYLAERGADIDAYGTHYTPYFVEISCYCIARYKKHDDVADYLMERGAVIDIHTAAFLGDLRGVKSFLKRQPESLNEGHPQHLMGEMTEDGLDWHAAPAPWATPLCYALRGGDVETVEYLIASGARIEGIDEALFNAANKDADKVRLLLENGADPRKMPPVFPDEGELFALVSSYGVPPPDVEEVGVRLVYLCRGDRGGNPDKVRRLLRLGADVDHRDAQGKTALHRAAKAGFTVTMDVLLEHGASVDIEDGKGETPLFDAIRSTIKDADRKAEAIRVLMKAEADPLHANGRGETAREVADRVGVMLAF